MIHALGKSSTTITSCRKSQIMKTSEFWNPTPVHFARSDFFDPFEEARLKEIYIYNNENWSIICTKARNQTKGRASRRD
jgi:hypothetical protein